MKTILHWSEPFAYTRRISRTRKFDFWCSGASGMIAGVVVLGAVWEKTPKAEAIPLAFVVFVAGSVLQWAANLWLGRAEVRLREDGIRRVGSKYGPVQFLRHSEIDRCVLRPGPGSCRLLEIIPRSGCPTEHPVRVAAIPQRLSVERLRAALARVHVTLIESHSS